MIITREYLVLDLYRMKLTGPDADERVFWGGGLISLAKCETRIGDSGLPQFLAGWKQIFFPGMRPEIIAKQRGIFSVDQLVCPRFLAITLPNRQILRAGQLIINNGTIPDRWPHERVTPIFQYSEQLVKTGAVNAERLGWQIGMVGLVAGHV